MTLLSAPANLTGVNLIKKGKFRLLAAENAYLPRHLGPEQRWSDLFRRFQTPRRWFCGAGALERSAHQGVLSSD